MFLSEYSSPADLPAAAEAAEEERRRVRLRAAARAWANSLRPEDIASAAVPPDYAEVAGDVQDILNMKRGELAAAKSSKPAPPPSSPAPQSSSARSSIPVMGALKAPSFAPKLPRRLRVRLTSALAALSKKSVPDFFRRAVQEVLLRGTNKASQFTQHVRLRARSFRQVGLMLLDRPDFSGGRKPRPALMPS